MNLQEIIEQEKKYILQTYKRQNVVFTKGKGVFLHNQSGNKYLDLLCGIAVTSLGHCHPKIISAIRTQAKKLIHTSNLFYTLPQLRLGKILFNLTKMKAFFCNSGAEANEAAIKLARKWGKLNSGKYGIITALNSFHGRTLAAITATGQEKYQNGFAPLVPGFKYVKFNDIDDLKKTIDDKTTAIMLELIQGESGVIVADKRYIKEVRNLCDEKNILLIIDEVQTGLGRCGKMFAYENYDIKPDIMTLAKSIAQGLPMGIMLAKPEIAEVFKPGDHASTFGGGPVVSKVAETVINIIIKEKLYKNAQIFGEYFIEKLKELKNKHSFIKEVRGIGLMIGVELDIPVAKDIVATGIEKYNLIINATSENVLRFLPPLIITKKQIDKAVKILDLIFEEIKK